MSDAEREEGGRKPGRQAPGRRRRPAASTESIDDRRYYRIGDVSRLTGVKAHVLRYWETEFRWMAPAKSRSKQRLYRKRDIEVIQLIRKLLYEERYTIAGARRRLQELGVARALDGAEPSLPPASDGPDPAQEHGRATADPRERAGEGHGAAPSSESAVRAGPPSAAAREALRRIREELVALRAAL